MRNCILTLLILIFISCGSYQDLKKVSYKANTFENPQESTSFDLFIPKNYQKEVKEFDHSLENRFIYDDSSIIFLSNDKWSASRVNDKNRLDKEVQDKILHRNATTDSIYLSGQQKDGRYWKENILNDIVVGYLNVSKERKEEFDKAIATIIRK